MKHTEDWPDIKTVLLPLLRDMKAARLSTPPKGMAVEHTIPVFHATDSYHKHRHLLKALYNEVWPELAIETTAPTPKGAASGAHTHPYGGSSGYCMVTGEPMHDIINLRKAASRTKNDYWDLMFDHIDMINRLSTPEAPAGHRFSGAGPDLAPEAHELLRMAVEQPHDVVEREVGGNHVAACACGTFSATRA